MNIKKKKKEDEEMVMVVGGSRTAVSLGYDRLLVGRRRARAGRRNMVRARPRQCR